MKRTYPILLSLLFAFVAIWQTGCMVTYQKLALADEVRLANQRFKQKRYLVARAMYRRLIQKYPEGVRREEMMLQIGRCFFNDEVRSLHDARMAYMEYIEAYPQGAFSDEARRNLERIDNIQSFYKTTYDMRMGALADRIEKVKKQIQDDPDNSDLYSSADLYYTLGNALWELKRYEEAVQAYQKCQSLDPKYTEDQKIMGRVALDTQGNMIPLTPEIQREIDRDRNPLIVFDDHAYNSRMSENFLSAQQVDYNVTGLVRNQSDRALRGVIIEVRFLNSARKILDSQTEFIGNLSPGAIRSFAVQSQRFDNIFNISSYECRAYEQ